MSCISSQPSSFIKLVSLGDFRRSERPDLDMAQCAGGFPGGEAQRLVPAGLDAGRNSPVAMIDGDDLLVIDQATDHLVGDADAEAVPGLVLIAERAGRLVLRGVHPIEAG